MLTAPSSRVWKVYEARVERRSNNAAEEDAFAEGDPIEAQYGGKEAWYSGKIRRVCGGGQRV